jgi:hypothetical protein
MEIWIGDVIFIVHLVESGEWALAKFSGPDLIVERDHGYATFEEAKESLEISSARIRKGWAR